MALNLFNLLTKLVISNILKIGKYRWRGGDLNGIQGFKPIFPSSLVVFLDGPLAFITFGMNLFFRHGDWFFSTKGFLNLFEVL